jgi:dipeptidyl aminopeptidase/acylaminoacyl peptidase
VRNQLLILCAAVAPLAGLHAQDRLPVEYFTRHEDFGKLKISPDGAYLAVSAFLEDEGHIAFYTLQPFKGVLGLRTGDGRAVAEFQWASATRVVYTLVERQPGRVNPGWTGEIYAVDRDGSGRKMVYGFRAGLQEHRRDTRLPKAESSYGWADIVSDLPDDDRHILVCEHPADLVGYTYRYDPDARPLLARIDIFDAGKKVIEALPLAEGCPLLDSDERARFAIGYDVAGQLAVMWKPEKEWAAFALPGFRTDTVHPQRFAPDNRSVTFIGTRVDEPFAALYRLDLETKKIDLLYAHPGADVGGVVTDLADKEVIGAVAHGDRPETHWLQPEHPTAKLYQMLNRAFPGQRAVLTSATRDQGLAIAFVHSDVNPGDYYLIDARSQKADFLAPGRAWVDPARMRPKEAIQFEARDGVVLHGYATRPDDGDGPHPMVVLPHGGPHGVRDVWGFDWEAQLLAHYGYAVLQVNFRGSDGYGEDFKRAGFREWGAKMQDDVTDATRWAVERKLATEDNVCIFGASYGGYAALMGAIREPGLYRCAASYVGVTDLELMFRKGDVPDSEAGRNYLRDVLGDDVTSMRARSPVHNAERIRIPILLIHGTADWRVDYEHATRMRDALERAGKQYEFVSLKQEGHGAYAEDNRKEVYVRLLEFLSRHLRGGHPPTTS